MIAKESVMRMTSTLIVMTSMLTAAPGTTFAHAWLQSAMPAVDSTVMTTPSELTITFTGAIEPRFSTIEVTDASAQRVDDAQPHLAGGDPVHLSVGLRNIMPGTYTVAWHATSVDTHQTDGIYRFTVAAADTSNIDI
jgi:methionine-rich copper-binding protein CopC